MDRPAWNRLHAAMAIGSVSKIVVWRLDRLGHTAAGLTALLEELQTRKIAFESIKDRSKCPRRLADSWPTSWRQWCRTKPKVRGERVMAGQVVARAVGEKWGGSEKGRRISVTDAKVATIKRMAKDSETEISMSQATSLSRPTVYRLLEQLGLL